jgi:hypothetical protein
LFYVNQETELSIELLQKMINRFRINVEPKLTKYKNYYDGIQNILNKSYADPSKPCSKTVINYVKNICDSYAGYLATPGYISYRSDDDIEEIMNILRYNDYQAEECTDIAGEEPTEEKPVYTCRFIFIPIAHRSHLPTRGVITRQTICKQTRRVNQFDRY